MIHVVSQYSVCLPQKRGKHIYQMGSPDIKRGSFHGLSIKIALEKRCFQKLKRLEKVRKLTKLQGADIQVSEMTGKKKQKNNKNTSREPEEKNIFFQFKKARLKLS